MKTTIYRSKEFMKNNNCTNNIDIHADDYALSINVSADILDCMKQGRLDSISIIPNMYCYDDCISLLQDSLENLPFLPKMSIHLNLVEGHCLNESCPNWLTHKSVQSSNSVKSHIISTSWRDLFFASYNPFLYNKIKKCLKEEIYSQITSVSVDIDILIKRAKSLGIDCNQSGIRIDSHQHTHMLPIVWDSITELINEKSLNVEYIRNSREPLLPFLKEKTLRRTYSFVNIIKNRILFFYSIKLNKNEIIRENNMLLWGLIMSGNMNLDRVDLLYNKLVRYSNKHEKKLEILFHPGLMLMDEKNEEIPDSSFNSFYINHGRKKEFYSVMNTNRTNV